MSWRSERQQPRLLQAACVFREQYYNIWHIHNQRKFLNRLAPLWSAQNCYALRFTSNYFIHSHGLAYFVLLPTRQFVSRIGKDMVEFYAIDFMFEHFASETPSGMFVFPIIICHSETLCVRRITKISYTVCW